MATAKVFRSGNSQAVRIPREFQFDTDEVDIERRGDEIILRRPVRNLRGAFDALVALPDDVSFARFSNSICLAASSSR
jgi:antitoxin VapB